MKKIYFKIFIYFQFLFLIVYLISCIDKRERKEEDKIDLKAKHDSEYAAYDRELENKIKIEMEARKKTKEMQKK